ncbi:MAG: RNA methyltransferase [Polaribacter sp.]|nr:MAG: RNA methyltransferase [Polaribacter sp.]
MLKSSLEVEQLFVLENSEHFTNLQNITRISTSELKKISSLKTPNIVLGLFKIPNEKPLQKNGLIVALDGINDPGNLGTIIRLCDWFGISQLVCSKNTVDCYNQKVIQSTMGSITRVQINYINLENYLLDVNLPIFTADMDGENIYKSELPTKAVLIMGNEANGISSEINKIVKNKLTIPRFGNLQQTESLNVATATAILLSEFKRNLN